jgi:hypothetical protein
MKQNERNHTKPVDPPAFITVRRRTLPSIRIKPTPNRCQCARGQTGTPLVRNAYHYTIAQSTCGQPSTRFDPRSCRCRYLESATPHPLESAASLEHARADRTIWRRMGVAESCTAESWEDSERDNACDVARVGPK